MSELKLKYKFIYFSKMSPKKWHCHNVKSEMLLGKVVLYEPWNQFVIEFVPGAIFNNQCLKDIANFLTQINNKPKELELELLL